MKYKRSLLAKLTWLVVAASILMSIILAAFAATLFETVTHRHQSNYGRMVIGLAQQVYQNPLPDRISNIAERNGLALRYRDPFVEYASDANMPRFQDVKVRRYLQQGRVALADSDGRLVALHRRGGQQLMVDLQRLGSWFDVIYDILPLFVSVLFLFCMVYAIQRRMLKPLAALRDDMRAVGEGNWRKSTITRNDEIGELAVVFNRMQSRLHSTLLAKERFLADASHELRSPLARLRLAAEFVEKEELRHKMISDMEELEHITSDIMEKTRLDHYAQTIHYAPLKIADLMNALRHKYPKVQFSGDESTQVQGDMESLLRAIGNLLDNALKFADNVKLFNAREKEGIRIVVEDDGLGVPDEDLSHLFEPFYRSDTSRSRETGGFGLGLSIVHAAVQAHGGKIIAENCKPHGLRVIVTLPYDVPDKSDKPK